MHIEKQILALFARYSRKVHLTRNAFSLSVHLFPISDRTRHDYKTVNNCPQTSVKSAKSVARLVRGCGGGKYSITKHNEIFPVCVLDFIIYVDLYADRTAGFSGVGYHFIIVLNFEFWLICSCIFIYCVLYDDVVRVLILRVVPTVTDIINTEMCYLNFKNIKYIFVADVYT